MQGGSVSAHAAVIATFEAHAICNRTTETVQTLAMLLRAMATVQAPAMCHRAMATAQALAMCHRASATVQAPAMCHCEKLSRAGVHTSGVLHASCLLSMRALAN